MEPDKNSFPPPRNSAKLPPFASTPDEIKRAVERSAIRRGELLIEVIVSFRIDEILEMIRELSYDKEDIYERKDELNIDEAALALLDNTSQPTPYTLFFAIPEFLVDHPNLVMYYRNVAMLSQKVMRGIHLPTIAYEEMRARPSQNVALELSRYFNGIISKLVLMGGVTPSRHLEMALSNIGDGLGGVSRNEVGRFAASQVMQNLIVHWHSLGILKSITYASKRRRAIEKDTDSDFNSKVKQLIVTPKTDIILFLNKAEAYSVKYQEIVLRNGYRLLLDRQLIWRDAQNQEITYRIGADMISDSVQIDMAWCGELKGGADPAGSDEHWKTATRVLNRILEAADKSGRPTPKLSFLATIIVERVAREAQQLIDEGRLTSVYNLTKITENQDELVRFLNDMTEFLGYPNQK